MSRAKLAVDVGNTNVLHPHLHTPDDIIDNILIRLPIKDAIRTSVLSKNWRLQWQKMSKLVFNRGCVPPDGLDWKYKLVRMIYSVLSLHVGPIQKFEEDRIKIAKILGCLLELSKLLLEGYSLQWFFSDGHILDRLPATHEHMEELHLTIDFTVKEEFLASLCLLRSFPNLKVLDISVEEAGSHNTTIASSSPPIDLDVTFHQLSLVRVVNMTGVQEGLLLVKSILASTPALRSLEISIDPDKGIDKSEIFIELLRYPRASTVSEIIYEWI